MSDAIKWKMLGKQYTDNNMYEKVSELIVSPEKVSVDILLILINSSHWIWIEVEFIYIALNINIIQLIVIGVLDHKNGVMFQYWNVE